MTANVHTDNRDYHLFLLTERAANRDVFLVMEIDHDWWRALDELRSVYQYRYAEPRPGNFDIALMSTLSIETLQVAYIGSAGVPSIQARIRVDNRTIGVIGVHPLPPSRGNSALRNGQLTSTADLVATIEGPVIVTGDLNVTPWSPVFRDFLTHLGLHDSCCGYGVQATWPSNWGVAGIPIDHVLVSEQVHVIDRRVGPSFGSDHRPIVADVSFGF